MAPGVCETDVESAALAWLESLGWQVKQGSDIAPDGLFAERRLRDALLPKLIRGEIRVKDAERFLMERGL
jgi:hypothetical protein